MGSAELLIVLLVLMCLQVLHLVLLHGLVPVDSVMETIDSIYAPVVAEDTSELGSGDNNGWMHKHADHRGSGAILGMPLEFLLQSYL